MATTTTKNTTISTGTCNFCQAEVNKTKMTQHLRYCKQRLASIAAKKPHAQRKQGRLLHLLVEGQYNPQYWMHLEIPAAESLLTLDGFLRDTWLECCNHLSSFTINGTHYSVEIEDVMPSFTVGEEGNQAVSVEEAEPEEKQELADQLIIARTLKFLYSYLQLLVPEFREAVPYDLIKKCADFTSIEDLILFLQETDKATKLEEIPYSTDKAVLEKYKKDYVQKEVLGILLRDLQHDRDMDVPLGKALKLLKPGKKFFHEYDFGSTTYLALRVIDEREGVLPTQKEDPVQVMARNNPPAYSCQVCGKPAELINAWDGEYGMEFYCKQCAKKKFKHTDEMLPVVNSPRAGVCGYTGH